MRTQIAISQVQDDPDALQRIQSWMLLHQPLISTDLDFQGISPWAETRHLSHLTWIQSHIMLSYMEFESSSNGDLQYCLEYLTRRIQSAQQHNLVFRVIECTVLKAQVLDVLGNRSEALKALSYAVALAVPRGYRRVFIDKGPQLGRILGEITVNETETEFVSQLQTAIEKSKVDDIKTITQNLIEPLSPRELEVLYLIAKGFTNKEIGKRLFLAINTVKGHNRNIFGKLGVKNRTQAVSKAQSLNILHP